MAYVQIYETVIDSKSVVGVGPFMTIIPADDVDRAFNKLSFYFDLYTTAGPVRISSNPHYFGRGAHERKHGQQEADYLRDVWGSVRANLLAGWEIDTDLDSLAERYNKKDQ